MAAEQPLSRKWFLHNRTDSARKATGGCLLLELEVDICHSLLLLEDPLLWRVLAQKSDILEEDLDNFGIVLETLG